MSNNERADHTVELKNLKISNKDPVILISGPCQLESLEHAIMIAEKLTEICALNDIEFIFK
jgi:2-dehydro-3-deoxyphosphooctonate aldolase (KDO 8-P synthase)